MRAERDVARRGGETGEAQGVTLSALSMEDYIREVLPYSQSEWAGERSFPAYVADFRSAAESRYRRKRFTYGLREGDGVVASLKAYDRDLHWGTRTLSACGIGAVFTRADARGRGYATAMLGLMLDAERSAGRDLAYLFSDIHPAFYERLGFIALPSRTLTLRAGLLDGKPAGGLPLEASDWSGVRRCFDKLESHRPWGLRRTPLVWDWIRLTLEARTGPLTQPVHLVVRRGASVIAYLFGRRLFKQDTFVIDDFGFSTDEGRVAAQRLVRAAAGDLARVKTWLPPPVARDALPRGSVRTRRDGIFMILPLSTVARGWWRAVQAELVASGADPVWAADHV